MDKHFAGFYHSKLVLPILKLHVTGNVYSFVLWLFFRLVKSFFVLGRGLVSGRQGGILGCNRTLCILSAFACSSA